jgi:hypothetical protein
VGAKVPDFANCKALPSLPDTPDTLTSVTTAEPNQPSPARGATISPPKVPESGKRNLKPSAAKACETVEIKKTAVQVARSRGLVFIKLLGKWLKFNLAQQVSIVFHQMPLGKTRTTAVFAWFSFQ